MADTPAHRHTDCRKGPAHPCHQPVSGLHTNAAGKGLATNTSDVSEKALMERWRKIMRAKETNLLGFFPPLQKGDYLTHTQNIFTLPNKYNQVITMNVLKVCGCLAISPCIYPRAAFCILAVTFVFYGSAPTQACDK